MKISADFSALWASARRMGSHNVDFDIRSDRSGSFEIDDKLSSTEGLDIDIEDLVLDNGVLSVEGRQVLLFIPDQGRSIDEVLSGREDGKKFHVADCRTLASMRRQKRFNRYKATYNVSGKFHVHGISYMQGVEREGEAELKVCKNCLTYLNYRGYATEYGSPRLKIFQEFDIAEFLSTYSTLFKSMPDRRDFEDSSTYSEDWREISDRYRESVGFRCESCSVDLSEYRSLLHTHHISGNKRENHSANLMALCLDCHRKQPKHGYMRIKHDQMLTINRLRKEQGLVSETGGWEQAIRLADKALDGLLRHYASKGLPAPEVGYELSGADGAVVAEIEVAWPSDRRGIAIGDADLVAAKELGWSVLTLGEALRTMNS